jgi:heme exporter protein A
MSKLHSTVTSPPAPSPKREGERRGEVPAIHLSSVTKQFGLTRALSGIHLTLPVGASLSIFGPNGAGKSTLLRIVSTLMKPTTGQCAVFGFDVNAQADAIRRRIGVLSHQSLLIPTLTAEENLQFYGRMFAVPRLRVRIDELFEAVGLQAVRQRIVETFSQGMQQRLAIARAMLHAPRLFLLDEPYAGLDHAGIEVLRQLLQTLRTDGCTLLMTSHDFTRGLEYATQVAILAHGKLAYVGSPPASLKEFEMLYQNYAA